MCFRCNNITTGSAGVNSMLEEAPVLAGVYGEPGTGKSQLLYDAVVRHAGSCGPALLVDLGSTPPAGRLAEIAREAGYPLEILDKVHVIVIRDRQAAVRAAGFILVGGQRYGLVTVDNVGGLAEHPLITARLIAALSLSTAKNSSLGLAAFQVRADPDTGEKRPALYEYAWPFVDFFIKLEKRQRCYTAVRDDKKAAFKILRSGLLDA